jgi:gluconate:H+ symporter, GntP family
VNHNTWLLLDTTLAVAALVVLIAWLKLNSFVALALVSLAAGLAAPMDPSKVAASFADGVGGILGKIAVVIGLGAILGQMLAESGGAERIATALVNSFGPRWLALAFVAAGFSIGLPVFFQVGLVLLIPIAETSAGKMGVRLSRFGLPLVAGLSVSHGLIPPHPGPMAALGLLHADVGKTILYGLLVGAPTAIIAGLAFARVNCGSDAAEALQPNPDRPPPPNGAPNVATALLTILLPVGLMMLGACAELVLAHGAEPRRWLLFFGDPTVAMLIAVLVSFYSLGLARGFSRRQILEFCNTSLLEIGGVLLIVGAGGGFSQVLRDSGVNDAVKELAARLPVSPLVLGWLLAAAVRVATGSATVAMVAACSLLQNVADTPGLRPELLLLAAGAGSLVLSHVNDGGFWLVQRYVRLTVPQTLRTWTIMETMISIVALGFVLLLAEAIGPKGPAPRATVADAASVRADAGSVGNIP